MESLPPVVPPATEALPPAGTDPWIVSLPVWFLSFSIPCATSYLIKLLLFEIPRIVSISLLLNILTASLSHHYNIMAFLLLSLLF